MNGKEFGEFVNKFQEQQKSLLLKKANDYALDVDVLSNFKLAGASINLKPEISALSNISTKVNDAQSYITLEEFIARKYADGTLNEYEPLLKQLMDDTPINEIDINLTDRMEVIENNGKEYIDNSVIYDDTFFNEIDIVSVSEYKSNIFVS